MLDYLRRLSLFASPVTGGLPFVEEGGEAQLGAMASSQLGRLERLWLLGAFEAGTFWLVGWVGLVGLLVGEKWFALFETKASYKYRMWGI